MHLLCFASCISCRLLRISDGLVGACSQVIQFLTGACSQIVQFLLQLDFPVWGAVSIHLRSFLRLQ